MVNDRQVHCLFRDVLYAPGSEDNLASIQQLTKKGFNINFKGNSANIVDANGRIIVEATVDHNLYPL